MLSDFDAYSEDFDLTHLIFFWDDCPILIFLINTGNLKCCQIQVGFCKHVATNES